MRRFAGDVEVLTDVADIDQNDPVGEGGITPLGPVGKDAPVEDDIGLVSPGLSRQRGADQFLHPLNRTKKFDLMGQRQVMIAACNQSFDMADEKIGFKLMTGTAAWNRPEGGVILPADALIPWVAQSRYARVRSVIG